MKDRLKGSYVALVTPFAENGEVDYDGLAKLIDFQIAGGTEGILVCGTTGESATLSHQEHKDVIKFSVQYVKNLSPQNRPVIMAGTGSNSTQEALELTAYAKEVGADCVLLITPYYNRPTPAGLIAHFEAIAKEVDIPTLIYNVPSRTGVNIMPETVVEIAKRCPNVIGIKEACGNLQQISDLIMQAPSNFIVMSGNDSDTYLIMTLGGKGVISVASNILPKEVEKLTSLCLAGKWEEARQRQFYLTPLFKALFYETNPIPVKTAMNMMGLPAGKLRLPMVDMQEVNREKLRKVLKDYQLL